MDYKKAILYITRRRSDELAAADNAFKSLFMQNSEFREAETAVRKAELDCAHGKIDEKGLNEITAMRDEVVKKLGVADMLYPKPHCDKCNDTGFVGKEICACVKRLALADRSDNVQFPLRQFNDIDGEIASSSGQAKTVGFLRMHCEKGEAAIKKNINLLGAPGTGKTYLASCYAGECALKGRTVVFITAFTFVNRALAYHTTFDSSKTEHIQPLLDCDVLIVDDLGTESIFKNVTLEYLYLVINDRQLHGRVTVITSNLTINEIGARYGERIASRLFDKKLCYSQEFAGTDIRKIKL